MSDRDRAQALRDTILDRARALADEYVHSGRTAAERITSDVDAKLRLSEDRELQTAKEQADRLLHRLEQAATIRFRAEQERLRWTLTQAVLNAGLNDRLAELTRDENIYLPVLSKLLAHAANAIDADELVAQVNHTDLHRLAARWEQIAQEAAPNKRIALAREALDTLGGVLVRTVDDRVRLNNTFEARHERLRDTLTEEVTEKLFASVETSGIVAGG